MGKTSGDDKTEPSLELPSLKLPGLGRRGKRRGDAPDAGDAAGTSETPAPEPAPVPATEAAPVPAPPRAPASAPAPAPALTPEPAPEPRRRARRERTPVALPRLSGWVAAAVTGVVVALVGGAATYAGLAACDAVRGVSSCGEGPGFLILVAILVLMVLLGSALLRMFGVRDPGSTSFLAVGVVAVVMMLTLLDVAMSPWMFLVVPALSASAFLLAHWVTTRFDESATGRRDWT